MSARSPEDPGPRRLKGYVLIAWLHGQAARLAPPGPLRQTRLEAWLRPWLAARPYLPKRVRWFLGLVLRRGLPPLDGPITLRRIRGRWRPLEPIQSSRSSASGTSDQGEAPS